MQRIRATDATCLPSCGRHGGNKVQFLVVAVLAGVVLSANAVPASVLANAKDSGAPHDDLELTPPDQLQPSQGSSLDASSEVNDQISVPHKRGVNLLIPEADVLDEQDGGVERLAGRSRLPLVGFFSDGPPPASALGGMRSAFGRELRDYDMLASLLNPSSQVFYGEPVIPSVSYGGGSSSHGFSGGRTKRMAAADAWSNARAHVSKSLRPKRSPGKLTPAEALTLLALLQSRDPSMSDFQLPMAAANGPNDVLPYPPNSVYQEEDPLALGYPSSSWGSSGSSSISGPLSAPYSDENGEWMNTWTDPAVDYLGFPLDSDTLAALNRYEPKPTKTGFSHHKRFMVAKKKRSVSSGGGSSGVDDDDDCKHDGNSKKPCLQRKHDDHAAHAAPSKVASA